MFLVGCVTMDVQPGMRLSKVNTEFYIFCTNGKLDNDHIVYVGPYKADTSISVYRVNPKIKLKSIHSSYPELCAKDLYFKDGILVSDEVIKKIKDGILIKEEAISQFIKENNLTPVTDFHQTDNSDFKIYVNQSGVRFYSKNYEFIDVKYVASEIAEYERKVKDDELQRIKALNEYNAQKQQELIREQNRIRRLEENERQRLIEVERQRLIEIERRRLMENELRRLEQQRKNEERRRNPFQ